MKTNISFSPDLPDTEEQARARGLRRAYAERLQNDPEHQAFLRQTKCGGWLPPCQPECQKPVSSSYDLDGALCSVFGWLVKAAGVIGKVIGKVIGWCFVGLIFAGIFCVVSWVGSFIPVICYVPLWIFIPGMMLGLLVIVLSSLRETPHAD